jgi:hypothetical protein
MDIWRAVRGGNIKGPPIDPLENAERVSVSKVRQLAKAADASIFKQTNPSSISQANWIELLAKCHLCPIAVSRKHVARYPRWLVSEVQGRSEDIHDL